MLSSVVAWETCRHTLPETDGCVLPSSFLGLQKLPLYSCQYVHSRTSLEIQLGGAQTKMKHKQEREQEYSDVITMGCDLWSDLARFSSETWLDHRSSNQITIIMWSRSDQPKRGKTLLQNHIISRTVQSDNSDNLATKAQSYQSGTRHYFQVSVIFNSNLWGPTPPMQSQCCAIFDILTG